MFLRLFSVLLLCASTALSFPALERRAISQELLDELTRFTNFSIATFQTPCPSPLGNTLVEAFDDETTSTEGFVARDDTAKEIIVAFRGSQELEDFIIDLTFVLTPLVSQGVTNSSNASVHSGFLDAYNSVASTVISTVSSQVNTYPDYTLISAGASLGAGLASIAGVSLASNFPDATLRLFTFGQPRTGNPAYADLAEELIGAENIYRAVHTVDGVPHIPSELLGFRHHGTEYWHFQEPSIPENVKKCTGQEDPTCSDSLVTSPFSSAHQHYFGQYFNNSQPALCE